MSGVLAARGLSYAAARSFEADQAEAFEVVILFRGPRVGDELDLQLDGFVARSNCTSRVGKRSIHIRPLLASEVVTARRTRELWEFALQLKLRKGVPKARCEDDACLVLLQAPHATERFVLVVGVDTFDRVLTEVDRFGLRRPVGVQLDELGHRGADVRGVHLDGDRLREEAVERNLAGVRSDRNLRSDESVDPHPVDVAPVVVLDQDDIGSVDRRAESSGHRRVGGLASDLDRESRDLGLRRFDDVDLVGRRRRGVALGAARQGENRGQERREEVTYHDPTPLRRSYWPVIFVSGIAHDRHRLTHQTRLVEKV